MRAINPKPSFRSLGFVSVSLLAGCALPKMDQGKFAMSWEKIQEVEWVDENGRRQPLHAGSGLVLLRGNLWAVADDLHHLIRLSPDASPAKGFRLFEGDLPDEPKARKKAKKDTEALFEVPYKGDQKRLVAFPSGSKENRRTGALVEIDKNGVVAGSRAIDFGPLLRFLETKLPSLNIEGGFVESGHLVLLQRGNSKKGFNALIRIPFDVFQKGLEGDWKEIPADLEVQKVILGSWSGVPLTLTDGLVHQGRVYFSAAAEGSDDTYNDGEIIGSVIGQLDGDGTPRILSRIEKLKIEGLTLTSEATGSLRFTAITDADDPARASLLLRIDCPN